MNRALARVCALLACLLGGCLSEDRPPPEVYTDFESRARLTDTGVVGDAANDGADAPRDGAD